MLFSKEIKIILTFLTLFKGSVKYMVVKIEPHQGCKLIQLHALGGVIV